MPVTAKLPKAFEAKIEQRAAQLAGKIDTGLARLEGRLPARIGLGEARLVRLTITLWVGTLGIVLQGGCARRRAGISTSVSPPARPRRLTPVPRTPGRDRTARSGTRRAAC